MPWQETEPVKERVDFIAAVRRGGLPITELCEAYGISRKTAYKWIERFEEEGPQGLYDQSRRPDTSPQRTAEDVEALLLRTKREFPHYGPKKIVAILQRRHRRLHLPAPSTASDILKRHGLVEPRHRRRRRVIHRTEPFGQILEPNSTWSADFKGDFGLKNGVRCFPLTITDNFSRYLLECRALTGIDTQPARRVFERVFREFGLPHAIRTDNGAPFACNRGLGFSALSLWWLRLGIRPERISLGQPQQNGRHERMHRTLKAETVLPPALNLLVQQRRFNSFRKGFNEERPHEALRMETPASVYRPSTRPYPSKLLPLQYPSSYEVRPVASNGWISFRACQYRISKALRGENLGLEQLDDHRFRLWLGPLELGTIDVRVPAFFPSAEDDPDDSEDDEDLTPWDEVSPMSPD
jgi:putative transposase